MIFWIGFGTGIFFGFCAGIVAYHLSTLYEQPKMPYLTAEDDPVLARIWDNEDDDIFDKDPTDEVFNAWEHDLKERSQA